MARLTVQGLQKYYGKVHALRGIDLDIQEGEFCVFVGPSGCGKSTLLRTISGLEEPSAGQVLIGGEDVTDFDPSERGVAIGLLHIDELHFCHVGLRGARTGADRSECSEYTST